MTQEDTPKIGSIVWTDLTVADAEQIRDFYTAVVGWHPESVDMGEYNDFTMSSNDGQGIAGICHARGTNAGLPAQWLMYVLVEDLDRSVVRCTDLGGEVLVPPKDMGSTGRYCVIRDPAGAVAALFQAPG